MCHKKYGFFNLKKKGYTLLLIWPLKPINKCLTNLKTLSPLSPSLLCVKYVHVTTLIKEGKTRHKWKANIKWDLKRRSL
jgi:hypothetical protein